MKKILIMCLIALGIIFSSCSKQMDSYYVRYEVEAYKSVAGRTYPTDVYMEMLSSDTIITKSAKGEFAETYGPYKYHDLTYLKISAYNAYILNGRIYVSKNEEPFALKMETGGVNGYEISYTIDY